MVNIPKSINQICVHTGNILNLNEVKKNAGQNASEELVESLKIALNGWSPPSEISGTCLEVRSNDESIKVPGVERKELRTSVKVFITSDEKEFLQEAIDKLLASLELESVDSVVVALPGGSLPQLRRLWSVLEANVALGRISRIGVSDVDTDLFVSLHEEAKTKPSIVQINLASCCVVPPALQEFCKSHDIQLLTHNDPIELLPGEALRSVLPCEPSASAHLLWAVRFLVHVKCRGVLATKGYITCARLN